MTEGNAHVTEETTASSVETFGVSWRGCGRLRPAYGHRRTASTVSGLTRPRPQRLNQHPDPSVKTPWRIGASADPNSQCRRVDEECVLSILREYGGYG